MRKIILASASPRRRELMEQIGLEFEMAVSDKEEVYTGTAPEEIVKELALLKARDVAGKLGEPSERIVIGADTVVAHRGRILGKPKDEAEAREMLRGLQGEAHDVYTGVAVLVFDGEGGSRTVSHAVGTKVFVRAMTDGEIDAYIRTGEPMDKAGAYGIQGRFAAYIEKIEGDYFNVVGLPVSYLYRVLKDAGYPVLPGESAR